MLDGLISRTFSSRLILSLRKTGWMTVWVCKLGSFSCLPTKSAESWTLKGGACTNALLNTLNGLLPLPTIYEHCIVPKDLYRHFSILRKCTNKFDCLMHEMVLIKELAPSLNVQSDSIQENLFAWQCIWNMLILSEFSLPYLFALELGGITMSSKHCYFLS